MRMPYSNEFERKESPLSAGLFLDLYDIMKKMMKPPNCPLCIWDIWLELFLRMIYPNSGWCSLLSFSLKTAFSHPAGSSSLFHLRSWELSRGSLTFFKYFSLLPAFLWGLSRKPALFLNPQSRPVLSLPPHRMPIKCCLVADFVGSQRYLSIGSCVCYKTFSDGREAPLPLNSSGLVMGPPTIVCSHMQDGIEEA